MTVGVLEVLVEPFRENAPGPHVRAVLAVLDGVGLKTEMGPFATTAEGPLDTILAVVDDLMMAGFAAGASTIQLRVERR